MSSAWLLAYRPRLALTAVLPSPKRSNAPPSRTLNELKFGTFEISGTLIAGVQNDAGAELAGMPALKRSHRPPRLRVSRRIFHWSCTYAPPSKRISCLFAAGPFTTLTLLGTPLITYRIDISP